MIKTLSKAQKMDREKFRIPRSVQDAIPIRRIFADGIFQVGNRYSKTWSFTDINYAIAGKEDKTSMFLDYSELLNESGFRTPKEDRIQEIARVLNVRKENFFTRAETPEDIIRTLIWYDWEHDCGGSVPIDAILLFDNFEEVEILLKEWYSQKEKLRTRKITGAEYLE